MHFTALVAIFLHHLSQRHNMLTPLINQLTTSFPQLTGKLTPPVFSQSTHLLSFFGCAPNVGQTCDHDKGFFIRQNFATYRHYICARYYKNINQSLDLLRGNNQLKSQPASKLSWGSGSKSEAAKIYLPNFPFQKGKECQLPTEVTLAARVCRREKFTLPPSTDSRIVLFNSLVTNLISQVTKTMFVNSDVSHGCNLQLPGPNRDLYVSSEKSRERRCLQLGDREN